MCGICGIVGTRDLEAGAVNRMVRALRHRGPDGAGVVTLPGPDARSVHLGHARLAILDRSDAGRQPMADPARARWIVFNGEVYNYRELRRELEALGERFRSRTDTEVVLRAYGRWGAGAVERFRGMFALAVWDARARRLFLARDRLGLKPLYYGWTPGGTFVFASEVRALLASGLVPRDLDLDGLAVYLWNGFLVAPSTLVRGVRAMLPGTTLEIGGRGRPPRERAYWRLPAANAGARDDAAVPEEVRHHFAEAVRLRLRADVPLGAFLSGGLDSSAIVATMASLGAEVRSFAVTFDEPAFDESHYARALTRATGHRHTEVRLTRDAFFRGLPAALQAFDQPSFDGVNSYFVSRAAREAGLTVALSGLGADEVFGGYPMFAEVPRLVRASRWLGRVPGGLRRWLGPRFEGAEAGGSMNQTRRGKLIDLLAAAPLDLTAAYQLVNALLRRAFIAEVLPEAGREVLWGLPAERRDPGEGVPIASPPEALSRLCLRLFLGERCLRDTDTTSMASSLEVRAPFTDHVFLERVLAIPAAHRAAGPPHKPFESEVFRGLLPEVIRRRPKQGFTFPFALWLRRGLEPLVAGTLLDRDLVRAVGLEPAPLARMWHAFRQGRRAVPWSRVWALVVLLAWCRRHGVRRRG